MPLGPRAKKELGFVVWLGGMAVVLAIILGFGGKQLLDYLAVKDESELKGQLYESYYILREVRDDSYTEKGIWHRLEFMADMFDDSADSGRNGQFLRRVVFILGNLPGDAVEQYIKLIEVGTTFRLQGCHQGAASRLTYYPERYDCMTFRGNRIEYRSPEWFAGVILRRD